MNRFVQMPQFFRLHDDADYLGKLIILAALLHDIGHYPFSHLIEEIGPLGGEVKLDHGTGLCTIDAPKAQGATGFLKKVGPIALKTVSIDSTNVYATVLAVSMDDKELTSSKQILVQTTTTCRPNCKR